MAIGDTVQAGLGRMDFSAFQTAGAAQAQANKAFGDAIQKAAIGFFEGQAKKKKNEEAIQGLSAMFPDAPPELIKSMAKNPEVLQAKQQQEQLKQQLAIARMRDATARSEGGANRAQKAAQMESEENLRNEAEAKRLAFYDRLNDTVSTGELTPEARQRIENFSSVVGPEDPRRLAEVNDPRAFIDRVKNDPSSYVQKPVYELEGNAFLNQFEDPAMFQQAMAFRQMNQPKDQKIARMITVQDGNGGFTQVGVDEGGNAVKNFGSPKPPGMYRTPKEAQDEQILVGRTKDAMDFNKVARENSNIAISQAEQAQQALKYLPETTGGLTSFVNEMKVIGESLGIDLPEGYQKDMADIGAFRQLTGQFLFEAMSNTKGAITEREMKLFRQISPDIDNSRAANKLMLEIYVKAGDRAKQRRDLIRDLQRKDEDPRQIQIAIEDFDDANSLINDISSLPRKTTPPPQAQTNRSGVRGGNPLPSQGSQTSGGFQIKIR